LEDLLVAENIAAETSVAVREVSNDEKVDPRSP